jgi:hypothetical protein
MTTATSQPAELLARALTATGRFHAQPVEHGCAVRVVAPHAAVTVWLPDGPYGYAWEKPTPRTLPATVGVDRVIAAVAEALGEAS